MVIVMLLLLMMMMTTTSALNENCDNDENDEKVETIMRLKGDDDTMTRNDGNVCLKVGVKLSSLGYYSVHSDIVDI